MIKWFTLVDIFIMIITIEVTCIAREKNWASGFRLRKYFSSVAPYSDLNYNRIIANGLSQNV